MQVLKSCCGQTLLHLHNSNTFYLSLIASCTRKYAVESALATAKQNAQGYSETVRTTSEAGSLIDLELFSPIPAARAASAPSAPAPQAAQQPSAHSGWDTFGETGGKPHHPRNVLGI